MNLLHLKYAVEVSRAGSINKAAEILCMGQPNLSRAIRELEASLGITIFERSSRGMVLTHDGEIFLRYANKVLSQVDEIESIYKRGADKRKKFSISVPRASYISDAFVRFTKTFSNDDKTELIYRETNSMVAIKNILEGEYKLGIIRYANVHDRYFSEMLEQKGLADEIIAEFTYTLVMSREHKLAGKDSISFKDLEKYTEIAHADPYVPSLPLAAVKKEELPENVEKNIYVFERCSQFELLSENKDTFMWVSPIPQKTLDRYGLIQKKCADNNKVYRDVLIYKKGSRLSELDKTFIAELGRAKRETLQTDAVQR